MPFTTVLKGMFLTIAQASFKLYKTSSIFCQFISILTMPQPWYLSITGYPVYHSMYDDSTWMKKFGNPIFQRHIAGLRKTISKQYSNISLLIVQILSFCLQRQEFGIQWFFSLPAQEFLPFDSHPMHMRSRYVVFCGCTTIKCTCMYFRTITSMLRGKVKSNVRTQ